MKIIYSRGFPYGAPLVMLRGGATRQPEIKQFLRERGFRWNGASYAYEHYLNKPELVEVLRELRDLGCEVLPKSDLDPGYLVDLDEVAA